MFEHMTLQQWRIQGGHLGQLPPLTSVECGAPLTWRGIWGNCPPLNPLIKIRPILVPIEVETKTKNTQLKLINASHFLELWYLRDGL